jgi:hypothetical protein
MILLTEVQAKAHGLRSPAEITYPTNLPLDRSLARRPAVSRPSTSYTRSIDNVILSISPFLTFMLIFLRSSPLRVCQHNPWLMGLQLQSHTHRFAIPQLQHQDPDLPCHPRFLSTTSHHHPKHPSILLNPQEDVITLISHKKHSLASMPAPPLTTPNYHLHLKCFDRRQSPPPPRWNVKITGRDCSTLRYLFHPRHPRFRGSHLITLSLTGLIPKLALPA